MMRRRMAQMNARMNPGGVPGGMPHHPTMVQGGMPNHANAAPGKPGSSAHPNQNVLEAVKKVQEEAKNQSLTMAQRDVAGRAVGPGVPQQGMQQGGMIPGQQGGIRQQQQQQQQNQQQQGMGMQQQQQVQQQQQQQGQWNNGAIRPGMAMQGQMQGGRMQGPMQGMPGPGAPGQPNMPGQGQGQRQTMQSR